MISSVNQQTGVDIEHIVIDGGSDDGSLELLREEPSVILVERPGLGLYGALNLGVRMAKGEVVGQLNCDDFYMPDVLSEVATQFECFEVDAVYGGAEMFRCTKHGLEVVSRLNGYSQKELTLCNIVSGIPMINARFFRKSIYDLVGGFDEGLKIASDREFLIRIYVSGLRRAICHNVVYRYEMHSKSLTLGGACPRQMLLENLKAAENGLLRTYRNTKLWRAYRYWHSWSVGYLVGWECFQGNAFAAIKLLGVGLVNNPLLLLMFPVQLVLHFLSRKQRRWSNDTA